MYAHLARKTLSSVKRIKMVVCLIEFSFYWHFLHFIAQTKDLSQFFILDDATQTTIHGVFPSRTRLYREGSTVPVGKIISHHWWSNRNRQRACSHAIFGWCNSISCWSQHCKH